MAQFVLVDTSILVRFWRQQASGLRLSQITRQGVEEWARRLSSVYRSDAIVTPVYVEFVAGAADSHELKLARDFLSQFEIIDQGRIPPQDWVETRRLAERVPRNRSPRQLGDCLIKAIAKRLKHDVLSHDENFPT